MGQVRFLILVLALSAGCAEVTVPGFGVGSAVETVIHPPKSIPGASRIGLAVRTPDPERPKDLMPTEDLQLFEQKLVGKLKEMGFAIDRQLENGLHVDVSLSYWKMPFVYGLSPGWMILGYVNVRNHDLLIFRGQVRATKSYFRSTETLIEYAADAVAEAVKRHIAPQSTTPLTPLRE